MLPLQLPFSAPLRVLHGSKKVVLRGPSWPFVDQKVLQLPFFAALRAFSRIKGVAVAVAILRAPPWINQSSTPENRNVVIRLQAKVDCSTHFRI